MRRYANSPNKGSLHGTALANRAVIATRLDNAKVTLTHATYQAKCIVLYQGLDCLAVRNVFSFFFFSSSVRFRL